MVIEESWHSNLKYSAVYIQKSNPFEQIFAEAIKGIKEHGKMAEREMSDTQAVCAVIFRTFTFFLGDKLFSEIKQPQNRMVEMYHAGTPSSVKKHIVENLSGDDGHIHCLNKTIAFRMGI